MRVICLYGTLLVSLDSRKMDPLFHSLVGRSSTQGRGMFLFVVGFPSASFLVFAFSFWVGFRSCTSVVCFRSFPTGFRLGCLFRPFRVLSLVVLRLVCTWILMDHAAWFCFHARDGIISVRCVCLGFFLPFALVVVLRQGSFQAALALSHLQVRDYELHFFAHHQVPFGTAVVHVRACLRIVSEMLSHFRRRDGGVECAQDGQVDRRSSHTCHRSTHAASWLRLEDQHPGHGVHTHVGVERMDPSWTTLHVQLVVREQDPLDVVSPSQQPLVQVRCDPFFHSLDVTRRQIHAQGSRPTHQPRAHRATNTHVSSPTCEATPSHPPRRVSSLLGVPSPSRSRRNSRGSGSFGWAGPVSTFGSKGRT